MRTGKDTEPRLSIAPLLLAVCLSAGILGGSFGKCSF